MLILKAIQFASEKHRGQERRGSGLPYVTHPIIVMELIQKYKGESSHIQELKCAALLHDTLEDTDTTYFELEKEFGSMVASIVQELTSDVEQIKLMGKNEYLMQKMIKMSRYAFILKLVDRLSNVLDEPGSGYVKKTLKMMEFLRENREDLTLRQLKIIKEIETACLDFQAKILFKKGEK